MRKLETQFAAKAGLLIVPATLTGPRGAVEGRFVLDTGAAMTTIKPELADEIGYSARDGQQRTVVRSAVGNEVGYTLRVAKLFALGLGVRNHEVNVFDLDFGRIDGLIGLNFLDALNYEIRSAERRILVEKISPPAAQNLGR